jgi:glycosyltransferase involved in cell wall biosynthesis
VTAGWLHAHALSQVEVWGRAVDVNVFNPARRTSAWRQRLQFRDEVVFLHVGRLAAEKNVDLLLHGFAAARDRIGDRARLVVAGDGPSARALRAAAPPGAVFVGFIDRERDLPALYASADAFLCASTTETLGLVILEAMASGIPVAAVAAGGVGDHLRDGVNGLAFAADPAAIADSIVRLTEDAEMRRRLGAAGRAWAVAIGWDRELDRLVESYREVVEQSHR